ncbi:cytochrome P450 [Ceraceosorus guamensis]|uniref:Cytochrome P450 n=1 Tax=Ceraceosorus guamensis TaxID=1522189 RepID=A0A316W788_9BASI|nr:cytochrome P450 [Ceraceosorus guamensis]PWN43923.1 cytochrome P450 [Ceraceosorus guamensis]
MVSTPASSPFARASALLKSGAPATFTSSDSVLVSSSQATPILLSLLIVATSYLAWQLFAPVKNARIKGSSIRTLAASIPRLGQVAFYRTRESFLYRVLGRPEGALDAQAYHPSAVRFNVSQHNIIVSGDHQDASTFFNTRALSFTKGYSVLFGGTPKDPDTEPEVAARNRAQDDKYMVFFDKNLKQAIRGERLADLTPDMVEDCLKDYEHFFANNTGNGKLDPHMDVYPLIFQLSVRTVGLAEHANSAAAAREMYDAYWSIERETNYWSTLWPNLPLRSNHKRKENSKKLFTMIHEAINKRIEDKRSEDDQVQRMIDDETSTIDIVRWCVGSLFAAVVNSSSMSAWLLIFVGAQPELRQRVKQEIVETLRKGAEERGDDYESLPTLEALRRVPLEQWEGTASSVADRKNGGGAFPLLHACLKETMRHVLRGTFFRYFAGQNESDKFANSKVQIGGHDVNSGDFLAYWIAGTHQNSRIYRDPQRFDPDRFAIRKEGNGPLEFIGWGASHHVCGGRRFAQLEIIIVVATFLMCFDYETVDLQGKPYSAETCPSADTDNNWRGPSKPVRLSYRRAADFKA